MPNELAKPTILIVDDDKAASALLALVLSEHYDISVADDGTQAIDRVTESRPDLVLLDVMMPGIDGYEVHAQFQELFPNNPLPVIFLTGVNDEEAELKALSEGAADFINKPYRAESVLARVRLQLELQAKTAELQEANEKLKALALIDPLTQLANRRHFDEVAYTEVERALRSGHNLSLVVVDIDHFKKINDNHGHLAGDIVLKEFARAAKISTRAGDLMARIGGEEFVYLLPNVDLEQAAAAAERFRLAVEAMSIDVSEDLTLKITVSGGVAQHQSHETVENTLERADGALYEAKQFGRNQIATAST